MGCCNTTADPTSDFLPRLCQSVWRRPPIIVLYAITIEVYTALIKN